MSESIRHPLYAPIKRAIDLAVSGIGLLTLAPPLAVIMIAIRMASPGPALHRQPRVGRNEQTFTCYKLRTMYTGVPQVPTHMSQKSAVTPIGAVLRRLKIDELPQLYNVLKGDMSLVGPRPSLTTQHELIEMRRGRNVFSIRPGVTGLAQVLGVDMSDPRRLARLDQRYLWRRSTMLDMRLLSATFSRQSRRTGRSA